MVVDDPSVYVAASLTREGGPAFPGWMHAGEECFSAPVRLQYYPALERWPSVGAQKFDMNRSDHSK